MKFLLTILLSLLVLACDNPVISFKKPCNGETAKQTVTELAEVKGRIQQIQSVAGENRTYWLQDSLQKDSKSYYRYQLLSKLPYTDVLLYTFCVVKGDCKQVFVEQKDGSLLPYTEMEKRTKTVKAQQKQFPAFFKQFTTDMAFRQQHLAEPLVRLLVQKDGSVLLTEEELLTDDINALQTYTFSYYPESVCCKNTEKAIAFVFIPVGDTWKLSEIWH
ncbi:hypothetical protein RCZ04_19180 [Capnocytophaga sp. HP1101]